MPATVEGKRRGPLRRSGFASQDAANVQLVQVRDLLALAEPSKVLVRNQIADLIKRTLAETGVLPSVEVVRRRVRTRQD
ncbi:hypothetical protein AB0G06_38310 [Nonomuraea dietziae]|uniref:hypothetical protein n=1 Tax=Nonomuraea dietziae TaxID=65515 RepID=UPI0033FA2308